MSLIQINRNEINNVEVTLEKINPHVAAEWLKRNTQNRKTSRLHVEALAHDMEKGNWEVNGDAIRFDINNTLIDGQHRLQAIIKSGVTIECLVIKNLPSEAFATIDTNKVRGGSDTLSVLGVDHAITVAAALRLIHASKLSRDWTGWGASKAGRQKITNNDMIDLYHQHPEIDHCAKVIMSGERKTVRKLLTAGTATFIYYWLSNIDADDADQFFEWMEYCEGIDRTHPVSMLRNRLIEISSSHGGRDQVSKRNMLALTFRAWNGMRDGEDMKMLRWSSTHRFPTPH